MLGITTSWFSIVHSTPLMMSSISPSQHAKTFTKFAFGATPMCGVPVLSPAPVPAAIPAT